MKKAIYLSALLLCLAILLCSCGEGIARNDGKELAAQFCAAISEGDFAAAAALCHPASGADEQTLRDFYAKLTANAAVASDAQIRLARYTGFESSLYTSDVDGARLILHGEAFIGDEDADFTVTLVRNDAGYGIYGFYFDP